MRRRLTIGAAILVLGLVVAGAGAYAYYFSGLRSTPKALTLSKPSPAASTASGLAGAWTVTSGSKAEYRVSEVFVGTTSPHEAVADTSTMSGGMTVAGDATGYSVSSMTFTAGMADLHSVDSVAGRNVTQRDFVVQRQIEVSRYPTASFTATSAAVPLTVSTQKVDLSVPGRLTIHGVTKDVTASAQAQVVGDKIEVASNPSSPLVIDMTDYAITPPQVPFTKVDSKVTLAFDIFLTKSA